MRKAKYPITDEKMKELLNKYPFLVYRDNYSGEKCFDEKKDLEVNYYKEIYRCEKKDRKRENPKRR